MKISEVTTEAPPTWQWQIAYEIDQRVDAGVALSPTGDTSIIDGVDFDIFNFDILYFLLRLSKKTASILLRHNMTKMSDILSISGSELLRIPGLGRRGYEQVVNGLARLGKTLQPTTPHIAVPRILYHYTSRQDRQSIQKFGLLRGHDAMSGNGYSGIFLSSQKKKTGQDCWQVNTYGLDIKPSQARAQDPEETWWVDYTENIPPRHLKLLSR